MQRRQRVVLRKHVSSIVEGVGVLRNELGLALLRGITMLALKVHRCIGVRICIHHIQSFVMQALQFLTPLLLRLFNALRFNVLAVDIGRGVLVVLLGLLLLGLLLLWFLFLDWLRWKIFWGQRTNAWKAKMEVMAVPNRFLLE